MGKTNCLTPSCMRVWGNDQWAINVKRTTDMALLLVESFAIHHPRCALSGLRVSVDSLLSTYLTPMASGSHSLLLAYMTDIHHFIAVGDLRKPNLTGQVHGCSCAALSIANDVIL